MEPNPFASYNRYYSLGYKLYSYNQVIWGMFFFGTLAGMVFMASNFRKLRKPAASRRVWFWGIVAILIQEILIMAFFFYDDFVSIWLFASIITLVYCGIGMIIASKYQERVIALHLDRGGKKYSDGRLIGLGLLYLLIQILAMSLISLPLSSLLNGYLPLSM